MNWIEKVYNLGIDTGCETNPLIYCPTSNVTRALMAQMVARTWNHQMPFTTPSSVTTTYTFNAANQLVMVQGPNGTVSFTYDGDGMRFSKTTVTGTVYYVRDPQGEVIEEWSGAPALLAEYVYLDGQRVCRINLNPQGAEIGRVYYHADMLGTPVAETNESGQLLVRSEYYPFGDEVKPGTAPDVHKFTGKELDDESGLYYFGARYYDAHLGRFVSVDPTRGKHEDPQSWNRYAYARDNPLKFVDPDGRDMRLTCRLPGGGDGGHLVLQVVDHSSGQVEATWSFGPSIGLPANVRAIGSIAGVSMPGQQTKDVGKYFQEHPNSISATAQTDTKIDSALAANINQRINSNEPYNFYTNNCATTAAQLVDSVVPFSTSSITPEGVFQDFCNQLAPMALPLPYPGLPATPDQLTGQTGKAPEVNPQEN